MGFDRKKFEKAGRESGLTKAEFAYVLGVSRMTVYEWLREGSPQHPSLQQYVDRVCDRLLLAVKKHVLPLSAALPRDVRGSRIASMKAALLDPR